jgi:uncharacterized damage-inducible protein DinB
MGIEDLTELYAYNGWANERVRHSIQDLDPEVFKRDLGASFGSLQGTVAHLVSAQWNWLRRWKGQSAGRPLPSEAFESPAEANRRWEEVDRALAGFVDGLDAAGLQQSIALTTPQGSSYSSRLWRAMLHVVNHSSYHRGQIAAMLRQVGATPQGTDLMLYYREPSR